MLSAVRTTCGTESTLIVVDVTTGESVSLTNAHPQFETIVQMVDEGRDMVAIRDTLSPLSAAARVHGIVTIRGNTVYIGDYPVTTALSDAILDAHHRDDTDWFNRLAEFAGHLATNPETSVRHRLWRWIEDQGFTLSERGHIIGYKAIRDGRSIHAGTEPVAVNGTFHTGHIPNPIGATVSIDPDLVTRDIRTNCAVGLHVGTFDYAQDFGRHSGGDALVTVHVNPAHVINVPAEGDKMRVSQYRIVTLNATGIV